MQNQYSVDAWFNDHNDKKLNNNITRIWNIRKFNYQINYQIVMIIIICIVLKVFLENILYIIHN